MLPKFITSGNRATFQLILMIILDFLSRNFFELSPCNIKDLKS